MPRCSIEDHKKFIKVKKELDNRGILKEVEKHIQTRKYNFKESQLTKKYINYETNCGFHD